MKNDKKDFLLVEVDAETKRAFKVHCAKKNVSMKSGINAFMKAAVKNK